MKVDIEKNIAFYKVYNEICNCLDCKNFYKKVLDSYPEIANYLKQLGIDILKPFELLNVPSENKDTIDYFSCQYIVFGECEDNFSQKLGEIEFSKCLLHPKTNIEEKHFVLEFGTIALSNYELPNEEIMFESKFVKVSYNKKFNVAFVEWKKFCKGKDYRKPLKYALKIIKNNPNCDYVADTRNGFENIEKDTLWVKNVFMKKAKKYGAKNIYFIIDKNNSLKEELKGQEENSKDLINFKYIYDLSEIEK